MRKHTGLAAIAVLVAGIASTSAQETYSTWSNHRDVFLNTTSTTGGASVSGDVVNFPVLVRLTARDSATFNQALAGGADVRFTKVGDAVRLKHQIESWDTATKTAAIWVLVDTVYGNNKTQKFRMHWGKAGVADSSNGAAVFSNGFTNVWHLGDAAGVAARPNAVAGGNAATPTNFDPSYTPVTGLIGKADTLRGGDGSQGNSVNLDYLNLGSITTDYSQGITFSTWIYQTVLGTNTIYYSASAAPSGTATGALIVAGVQGVEDGIGAKFRQRNGTTGSNSGIINTDGAMGGVLNRWAHVLYTLNASGDMTTYLDGNAIGTASGIAMYSNVARPVNQLGATLAHMNYGDYNFSGIMDEARLANVGRSADWAKLEYENQKLGGGLAYFDSASPVTVSPARFASKQDFSVKASSQGLVFQVGDYAGSARLTLVDMWGRTVWKSGFAAGSRRLAWDGRTVGGSAAAPGLYLARLELVNAQGRTVSTRELKVPLTR